MKKTAVEWLVKQYAEKLKITPAMVKQAKEMFEEQMCEFTNDYVLTQCNASFEGNVSAELSAEEYYELTFKSK